MNNQDKIEKLEKQLYKISKEIYELGYEEFRPLHPFILVRVLPKDHISVGGILLPDTAQNKPVYEAIVIKVWEPYDEIREENRTDDYNLVHTTEVTIHHECSVKPGQRIAFPHYEGVTFPYGSSRSSKESFYKLIREGNDQNKYPYMNVLGVLSYDGDRDTVEKIESLCKKINSITTSGVSMSRGAY